MAITHQCLLFGTDPEALTPKQVRSGDLIVASFLGNEEERDNKVPPPFSRQNDSPTKLLKDGSSFKERQ